MFRRSLIIFFLLTAFLAACTSTGEMLGLNTAQKTAELRPGMTFPQVTNILGKPKSSVFTEEEWQINYSLHEYWKGWVPYVLVFDKKTLRLKSWTADEEAYQRNQEKWMQIMNSLQQQPYGGGTGADGSSSGGVYGDSTIVAPSYDPGYSEPSQFELDSAGYPGGAYENPSSSYYDPNY
jgi:hypothetical protein